MKRQTQAPAVTQLNLQKLPLGLTEARIRAHQIAPAHIQNIQIEEVDERREVKLRVPIRAFNFKKTPQLDPAAFCNAIHTTLKDSVVGYCLQLQKNGSPTHNLTWNWAQTPSDKNVGWKDDVRMHIASVSKLMTAIGLVHLLDRKNISYDAKIIDYLPSYWNKGSNISQITFRHLLTHRSGFSTGGSKSDFLFMKQRVAMGVPGVGNPDYENMNFGLCRILMPVINGDIAKGTSFMADFLNDFAWDAVTLSHYNEYMQKYVFGPAGVTGARFESNGPKSALAYRAPGAGQSGWDSGDLASMAGGAAWHLTPRELLQVVDCFRHRNKILSPSKAQYVLDNYFGIDQVIDTPAGKIYNKNGLWRNNNRTEQCVAYFFPDRTEVAVFVNSPIGTQDYSLRDVVKTAFLNSLAE